MKAISEKLIIESRCLKGDLVSTAFLIGARQLNQLMHTQDIINTQEYFIVDKALEAEINTYDIIQLS